MFSSALLFLDIGGPEVMLIMFVALLLFGGDKLPELARGLGKGIRDFKDASEGVKREINNQIDNYENKKTTEATPAANAELAEHAEPAQLEEHKPYQYTDTDGDFEDVHKHQPVANTIPAGQSHVTATDQLVDNGPIDPYAFKNENHTDETHVSTEAVKTGEQHKL
ncbi:MAG: twin-arginine translocase TatA/TatE family subunit [Mucilaginibacter sp.]